MLSQNSVQRHSFIPCTRTQIQMKKWKDGDRDSMKCVATDFALVNNMSARFAEDGIVVRFINFRLADSLLCSFFLGPVRPSPLQTRVLLLQFGAWDSSVTAIISKGHLSTRPITLFRRSVAASEHRTRHQQQWIAATTALDIRAEVGVGGGL